MVDRKIYTYWAGERPLPEIRKKNLDSLRQTAGVPVVLLRDEDLYNLTNNNPPLPEAFQYLSDVHKSDVLRIYLMHHYGGGWSDIKANRVDWSPYFDLFDDSDVWAVGYREMAPRHVATRGTRFFRPWRPKWWSVQWLKLNYKSLIGLGAYVFRSGTPLTEAIYEEQTRRLNNLTPKLKEHPAQTPRDKKEKKRYKDGRVSKYPVPWTHLLGDIFHPTVYEFRHHIRHDFPGLEWSKPHRAR